MDSTFARPVLPGKSRPTRPAADIVLFAAVPPDATLDAAIARLYRAYNARDLEALSALVRDDVDWPDGERRLHGRAAVRAYWSRQWARVRTHDEVIGMTRPASDGCAVRIAQVVRDPDGAIVSRGVFEHSYAFRDGLVARMDLTELGAHAAESARRA